MKREIIKDEATKGELYFGVEVECLIKGTSLEVELGRIASIYGEELVVGKHDGTVGGNAEDWMPPNVATELVISPMTLECYQNRKWSMFNRILKPRKSWTGALGGHIHMSLSAFANRVHLYKYMKFIRTNIDYIKWIGERDFTHNTYVKAHQSNGRVVQQVLSSKHNDDRYEVLNITKFGTLENRFWCSPFTREHMLKNIEWCHALWTYTKEAQVHFTVDEFHKWLHTTKHVSDYTNVINFISKLDTDRKFVTNEESYNRVNTQRNRSRNASSSYDRCESCGADDLCSDDVIWVDGEPFCRDCVYWCNSCEEYFAGDDYTIVDDETWCPHCAREYASSCDCCGDTQSQNTSNIEWVEFRGQDMCEDCRTRRDIYYCCECEEHTEWADGRCTVCAPEEEEEEVEVEETPAPF